MHVGSVPENPPTRESWKNAMSASNMLNENPHPAAIVKRPSLLSHGQ